MVTVLGHRGMLGSVVERRWKELGDTNHVVVCLRPDDLPLIRRLAFRPGVIVPSTDAISEDTPYAKGKREIEAIPGLVVIRSGIVDITRQPVEAYDDWFCNPLTPLEWADLAWERKDHPGVHVEGRETVSRYDVARMVREVFARPKRVTRRQGGERNRVQANTRNWPPLRQALEEYRTWLLWGPHNDERLDRGKAQLAAGDRVLFPPPPPVNTNAIAGPQTQMPRGVR